MPAYGTATEPPSLAPGDSFLLFDAEAIAGLTTSQQVYLLPDVGTGRASCLVELFFSGSPGSFEVDLEYAATDSTKYYVVNSSNKIAAVDTNQYAQLYLNPLPAGFFRASVASHGNAVNLTVKVTR